MITFALAAQLHCQEYTAKGIISLIPVVRQIILLKDQNKFLIAVHKQFFYFPVC